MLARFSELGLVPALFLLALAVPASDAPPPQDVAPAQALPRSFAQAEDVTGAGSAFVELTTSRDTYLAGEPFALQLRFGFERELLERGLVQLFQRPLDVPAQVFAPALEELEGVQFLDPLERDTGASFALDEAITRAARVPDEERAGRTYAVFEYERRVAGLRPGEIALAAPLLGFASATRFRDDFVLGPVPLDRRDLVVRGRPARVVVAPLPEDGRPAEFTGAIGRFEIRATAEPHELELGQSLKLSLVVEGQGDLSGCAPPALDGLAGFHLQGSLVERGPARLAVLYDLAPLDASVTAVPPIRFAFFDTTPPAGYRTLETEPIAISVRPGTRAPDPDPAPPPAAPETAPSSRWLLAPALALGVLAWLVLRRRRAPRA